MDDDQLFTFCDSHLGNATLKGFEVTWEHPGFLSLTPSEGAPMDSDGCPLSLIVTPDFINGEPSKLAVEIMFEGVSRSLGQIPVEWVGDPAVDEKTWRDVVERFRPAFARAIELARSGINPADEDVELK